MPDTCVPTSTWTIGSMVPVAVTVFTIDPRCISAVLYFICGFSLLRRIRNAATASTAITTMAIPIFFNVFMNYIFLIVYSVIGSFW